MSLNAWWTEDELDYALEDCGATVLIADVERVRAGATRRRARLGCRDRRAVRAGDVPAGVDRWEDVRARRADADGRRSRPTTTPRSSTPRAPPGHPKGAVSTHRAVVQALMGFGCKAALDTLRRPDEADGADAGAAGLHPHRAAVPRDRVRAR